MASIFKLFPHGFRCFHKKHNVEDSSFTYMQVEDNKEERDFIQVFG